jgi:hypothetical protein
LGHDVFDTIANETMERWALWELRDKVYTSVAKVRKLLGLQLYSPLFCVLDEAQLPIPLIETCFRSESKLSRSQAVINCLYSTFMESFPDLVISGTGLSIDRLISAIFSRCGGLVAKPGAETITVYAGAFEHESEQSDYLVRYLPHNYMDGPSGKRLAARLGFWSHGRRVSMSISSADPSSGIGSLQNIEHLLSNGLESPHRTLDQYINEMTNSTPCDADDAVEQAGPSTKVMTRKRKAGAPAPDVTSTGRRKRLKRLNGQFMYVCNFPNGSLAHTQ